VELVVSRGKPSASGARERNLLKVKTDSRPARTLDDEWLKVEERRLRIADWPTLFDLMMSRKIISIQQSPSKAFVALVIEC
jgi:hypothetical protein